MALNPTPIGKAIADYLYSARMSGQPPQSLPELETIWENIMTLIYNDIKENMDVLPVGSPATGGPGLESAPSIPGEVTSGSGSGGTTVTTASEPIIGTGSVQ